MIITTHYCDFCDAVIADKNVTEFDFNFIEDANLTQYRTKDICKDCKSKIIDFLSDYKLQKKTTKIK